MNVPRRRELRLVGHEFIYKLVLTNALALTNLVVMTQPAAVDTVLRTLADPTRRAVFERIVGSEEITVSELTRGSGVTQGAISQHIRTLKLAGLIAERPEGRMFITACSPTASRRWSSGWAITASSGATASPTSEHF